MSYPNVMQAVYVQQLANALFIDQVRATQINPVPQANRLPRWQQLRNIAQHAHIVNNRPARALPIAARVRGLKLPGVLKRLPVVGVGFALFELLDNLYNGEPYLDMGSWIEVARCAVNNNMTHWAYLAMTQSVKNLANGCATNQAWFPHGEWPDFSALPSNATGMLVGEQYRGLPNPRYTMTRAYERDLNLPNKKPEMVPGGVRALPRLNFPPAASVAPGRYIAPRQVMPEWPDAGYGVAPDSNYEFPEPNYLRSQRPGPRERERKVRLKSFAIGRTLEWLVSNATEGLDMLRALFEALPFWRKMQLYNAARRLELRRDGGRIVAGRLHYVDLTPQQKMQAIYDYIDEIDVAQAIENAVKMQLTDMFWAEIGKRMGRYQIGPWDDHGYQGPEPDPDWQWYVPDTAPDTSHNHWTYETLVNRRLTRKEAERIHRLYDQYRSQPYEG